MNRTLRSLLWAALASIVASVGAASAQTAQLSVDSAVLDARGGTVRVLAALHYTDRPDAIGWSIALPAGWSLQAVGGGSPPQIQPAPGSTGALEFAYTTAPDLAATFEVTVRYPAQAERTELTAEVLIRSHGRLTTLQPKTVALARSP